MIGANSIIKNLIIPNTNDKAHSFEVIVQANKNYGICDVVIPHNFVAPEKPTKSTKEANFLYKEKKSEYDANMARVKEIRNQLLWEFQGRQINDSEVRIHLTNVLYSKLNG